MSAAMILAAGRGERMRPLSDTMPKPLLPVGGMPLIVWQVRALARAGFDDVIVNVSHLADRLIDRLGDGRDHGVRIRWSREAEPLETAGGIATAMPLLPEGPVLIVSGDIFTAYDYSRLVPIAQAMARDPAAARVHLVMVRNPSYHAAGDFALARPRDAISPIAVHGAERFTYGNIGIYDTALFRELPRGAKLKLLPFLLRWIEEGRVTGELYEGAWENVGTPGDLERLDAALARVDEGESR